MPVIDVHCHTTPAPYVAELRKVAAGSSARAGEAQRALAQPGFVDDPQMTGALDARVPLLDEAGIDLQIISGANPTFRFSQEASASAATAGFVEAALSAACQPQPRRLRLLVCLPPAQLY